MYNVIFDVENVNQWNSNQLFINSRLNIISFNYIFIDIRSYTGSINGKIIAHHDAKLTNHCRCMFVFLHGSGYENETVFGYGHLHISTDGSIVCYTDIADVSNISFIAVI